MPSPAKLIRLLVLSNKFPYPLKDGGAIATYNMLRGLSKVGCQISLLSFNTKKHYSKPDDFPIEQFEKLKIHTVFADTTPKVFPAAKNLFFSSKPYILTRFSNTAFKEKLEHLLKNDVFDIIQIEGLYLLQYAPVIRKNSNALIAYRAHNIESEIWLKLAGNTNNFFRKLYLKNLSKRIEKYEQNISKEFDLLIPISENDKSVFKHMVISKPSHVCPVGFDIQKGGKPHRADEKKELYFIGSLDWLPNQEAVLWFIDNCWTELKNRYPNINLSIAGRNAPESFADKLDREGIIFKAEVKDASEFIRDKDIMIVPLRSGSGMRVKIIEAFLHNKAVVSTTLGALGTKSINNEQILIADSPKEFIDKIGRLLEDEGLFENIIAKAHQLVSINFDIFKLSNSLLYFYKQELKKQE